MWTLPSHGLGAQTEYEQKRALNINICILRLPGGRLSVAEIPHCCHPMIYHACTQNIQGSLWLIVSLCSCFCSSVITSRFSSPVLSLLITLLGLSGLRVFYGLSGLGFVRDELLWQEPSSVPVICFHLWGTLWKDHLCGSTFLPTADFLELGIVLGQQLTRSHPLSPQEVLLYWSVSKQPFCV